MGNVRKRAWIAALAGSSLSVTLFVASYATDGISLAWAQAIVFLVCVLLRGVHSSTKTDFALIGLPINAIIYSLAIFALASIFGRKRTSG